jgi:phosphoglucomutase
MKVSPLAGHLPPPEMMLDVSKLVTANYTGIPDPWWSAQRVAFGTSGHRGSAFEMTFEEWYVLAISEAICPYRRSRGIDGPLFLGFDTHALSVPAYERFSSRGEGGFAGTLLFALRYGFGGNEENASARKAGAP